MKQVQSPSLIDSYTDFDIVELSQDDIQDIHNLEELAWGVMSASFERINSRICCGRTCYYGAKLNGKLYGHVAFVFVNGGSIHNRKWSSYTDEFPKVQSRERDCLYIVSLTASPHAPRGVGRNLLNYTVELAKQFKCKCVAFGSRIPNYIYNSGISVENYVNEIYSEHLIDPVLSLAKLCGFEPVSIIGDYFEDENSLNYGVIVRKLVSSYEKDKI